MKRTPLKRGRPKPKVSMAGFWAEVTRKGCEPCALEKIDRYGFSACQGRTEAHHHIPKSRLPDSAKADPRNGVPLCTLHHTRVTNRLIVSPRPPLLDEFLADHGLLESGRPDPKREAA